MYHFQAELTRQQNEFKIKLKELEDSLLSRLSSAGGNFLGDTALVENLETTKKTAKEIEEKVSTLSFHFGFLCLHTLVSPSLSLSLLPPLSFSLFVCVCVNPWICLPLSLR